MEDEPFDFNTPITENTTLLAKWDCPEPGHTLDDLLTALRSDDPAVTFPVNTQIDDYTNGSYDPWVIGHYGTQYGDSETTGVYLYRKYVHPVDMAWGTGDSYAQSDINTYLNGTYFNSCSDAIKNAVAEIELPLVNGTTPAKMWLMSAAEVMGMSTGYAGGVAWDGWKERTGLTSPSTQPNAGRVMAKGEIANGSGDAWRLRTEMENNSGEASVTFDGAIRAITSSVESGLVIACFVPKPLVPNKPDLSKVLTKQDLDDIQAIVAAGKASEKFNLGDELLINYGTLVMPFEVVGFDDVTAQINGEEKTVHALNLLSKYTSDITTTYGGSGSTKYSESTLRNTIVGSRYQGALTPDFVACLANTKVQTYSRDDSTDVVYDKLFAPSMAQLGVTDTAYNSAQQASVEGPAFTAYQNADNAKRIRQAVNATGTAQAYWTRSLYSGAFSSFSYVNLSGAPSFSDYINSRRVVVACNLIGESPVAPASLSELKEAIDAGKEIVVGTEIPDTYDGQDNPLIVAQQLNPSNNESYGGAEGVILVRKYVKPTAQIFGGSSDYPNSTIFSYLNGEYLNATSSQAKALISDFIVPYYNGSAVQEITGKWHLLSGIEVGGTKNTGEGIFTTYFKNLTGLSTPSDAANSNRVMRDPLTNTAAPWLRSRVDGTHSYRIKTDGSLDSQSSAALWGVMPACFIAKGSTPQPEETLTSSEYDALDLTAQAYDNYDLTAEQYDNNGKNLLK